MNSIKKFFSEKFYSRVTTVVCDETIKVFSTLLAISDLAVEL